VQPFQSFSRLVEGNKNLSVVYVAYRERLSRDGRVALLKVFFAGKSLKSLQLIDRYDYWDTRSIEKMPSLLEIRNYLLAYGGRPANNLQPHFLSIYGFF